MGKKKPQKTKKLVIEFDADARKEYVLGMHKRKEKRKAEAIDNLKKQVKIERKTERTEVRVSLFSLID